MDAKAVAARSVPPVNKKVMIAALVIGGTAVLNIWSSTANSSNTTTKPYMTLRVLFGTYLFLLVVSFLDLFRPLQGLVGALAMLAAITMVIGSGVFATLAGFVNQGAGQTTG